MKSLFFSQKKMVGETKQQRLRNPPAPAANKNHLSCHKRWWGQLNTACSLQTLFLLKNKGRWGGLQDQTPYGQIKQIYPKIPSSWAKREGNQRKLNPPPPTPTRNVKIAIFQIVWEIRTRLDRWCRHKPHHHNLGQIGTVVSQQAIIKNKKLELKRLFVK